MKLFFCQNNCPIRGELWQKISFHNSYTFWGMPILIFSPVQIIMTHPLVTDWFKVSKFMAILSIEKQIQLQNLQTLETKVWTAQHNLLLAIFKGSLFMFFGHQEWLEHNKVWSKQEGRGEGLLGFPASFFYTKWHPKSFSSKKIFLLLVTKKVNKFDRFSRGWMISLFCFLQPKNILVSIPHTFQSVPSSFS